MSAYIYIERERMKVQKKERDFEKQILKENRGLHGSTMELEGVEQKVIVGM